MELGGLFKEFTNIISEIYNRFTKIDKTIVSNKETIDSIQTSININKENSDKSITDIDKKINNISIQINNEFKAFKEDISKFNLSIEDKVESLFKQVFERNADRLKKISDELNTQKNLTAKSEDLDTLKKELINNITDKNNFLNRKLNQLEESIQSYDTELKKLTDSKKTENKRINSDIQRINKILESVENKYQSLEGIINSFKINKSGIIKSLQDKGTIDLMYNLKITPRVLPKKGDNGVIILDVKDGKFKYWFNNEWKII